jgi:ribosomal protein L16/L10AE
VEENVARQAFARINAKMPYRCRMVVRRHGI